MTPQARKKLFIIAAIVLVFSFFSCKKTNVSNRNANTGTTDSTKTGGSSGGTGGGGSGGTGGGGGGTGGGGGSVVDNYFDFHQKINEFPYPDTNPVDVPQINNYVAFQFASWSIVSKQESAENSHLQSWMRFELYDSSNNLVCAIQNKQGNYHPNFAPFFPAGTDLRHNNHQYQYRKYLPTGNYRIEYYNISPQAIGQDVRLGTQGTGGNVYANVNENVGIGHRTFNFSIELQDNGRMYEFDCNPH